MTTHTSAPGRREDAHSGGRLVFAAVVMIFSGVMTLLGGISAIAIDALVVRGLRVAPRPTKN
ncbi:hypothetical protein [Streptomyces hydrogenans]|uniref:hypothetical protein n=1 Tax=Streptomyces hydrogenans TaxID=1873719 RepID=UPI00344AE7D3